MTQKFRIDNWIPMGDAFHQVMMEARVTVWGEDGVAYTNDPEKLAELVAAYDPLTPALAAAILRVKEEAQRRIYIVLPAYKQTNLMAQGLQNALTFGPDSTKWPPDQQALKAYTDARWLRIKALRDASNSIEAKLNAMTDWQELEAYDATTDASWPE